MSNKKLKILISGKLPKTPTEQSKQQFLRLADSLKENKNIGLIIFPTAFGEPAATWDSSIRSDIINLMGCNELHLLPNWQGHKRSEILRNVALSIPSIRIHYH